MQGATRSIRLHLMILACTAVGALSGCSLGALFGGGGGDESSALPAYREPNLACAGLNISSAELNVPSFRKILNCFNANGALEPIARLVERQSDSQLLPIVNGLNRFLILRAERMAQIEKSYEMLDERRLLGPGLDVFGRAIEQTDWITAGAKLWNGILFGGSTSETKKVNLAALEFVAEFARVAWEPKQVSEAMELALTWLEMPSFRALGERWAHGDAMGESYQSYLKDAVRIAEDGRRRPLGLELFRAWGTGHLEPVLDAWFGQTEQEVRKRAGRFVPLLKFAFGEPGAFLEFTSLSRALDRPVECLGGETGVPNALLHGIEEWGLIAQRDTMDAQAGVDFVLRQVPLMMGMLRPFCAYPAEVPKLFPVMQELAQSGAFPAANAFLAGIGRDNPVPVFLLKDFMADLATPRLLPLFSAWFKNGAWENIFLWMSAAGEGDRARLRKLAQDWSLGRERLGGRSLLEAWARLMAFSAKPADFSRAIQGVGELIDPETGVAEQGLRAMRSAFYVNDAHPFIDLMREIFEAAPKDPEFLRSILGWAEDESFRDSVRLMARMGQDGRLKNLVGSVLAIFQDFASRNHQKSGQGTILARDEPPREPPYAFPPRHRLRASDLPAADAAPALAAIDIATVIEACGSGQTLQDWISTDWLSLSHADQSLWWNRVLKCWDEGASSIGSAVVSPKPLVLAMLHSEVPGGKSGLQWWVERAREFGAVADARAWLQSFWMSVDSGALFRFAQALPFWAGDPDRAPLRPLLDSAPVLERLSVERRRIEKHWADFLRDERFPSVMRFGREIRKQAMEPDPDPEAGQTPGVDPALEASQERFKRWVQNRECVTSAFFEEKRTREIIRDFLESVNGWELVAGRARHAWSPAELKSGLDPVLIKIGDPKASAPGRPLPSALTRILRYFTLEPGHPPRQGRHYTPSQLFEWLRLRSQDARPIAYFYPGEKRPRVRLVSSLDRLELILVNSDLVLPSPLNFINNDNFGLKFLALIGESWGDEPRELWPEEIRKKYPQGLRPPTLRETYGEILRLQRTFEKLAGFPQLPHCARRPPSGGASDPNPDVEDVWHEAPGTLSLLTPHEIQARAYNLRQILSVVEENLPGSGTPASGGMRVLRDLFYELQMSTPPQFRRADAGWNNNLSVIVSFVKMGFMRQISRHLRGVPANDPVVSLAVQAFARAVASPEGQVLPPAQQMIELMVSGQRRLFWNFFGEIYASLGGAFDPNTRRVVRIGRDALALSERVSRIEPRFMPRALEAFNALLKSHAQDLASQSHLLRFLLKDGMFSRGVGAWVAAVNTDAAHSATADDERAAATVATDWLSDPLAFADWVAIAAAIDADPVAGPSWARFVERVREMRADPAYAPVQDALEAWFDHLLDQFASDAPATRTLRLFVADFLVQNRSGELLHLIAADPNGFYELPHYWAQTVESGGFQALIERLRRGVGHGF